MFKIGMTHHDGISPGLAQAMTAMSRPRAALAAGAGQLVSDLQAHLLGRNRQPNKRGWPKRNFWAGIRRSTAIASLSNTSATVAISDPAINQKVFGGILKPKRGKYLAIPARPEAYKAGSPRELPSDFLKPVFSRGRKLRGLQDGQGSVWYWLVKSVTQQPDPNALPPDNRLRASVSNAIQAAIQRSVNRA